jgi:hypothetical protein
VVIRTGIVLPTFRDTPDEAFAAAAEAVEAGVDGLFCYDHIWPLGQPERPALAPFPILGALAARHPPRADGVDGPFLGTLVARVGLAPNDVLAAQFVALNHLAPGRVIAGLGTGDKMSEQENRAYGIPYPTAAERRAEMVSLGRRLIDDGLTVWIGGGTVGRRDEAHAAGAALNLWDAEAAVVAEAMPALGKRVSALKEAGATWVIFGWPVDLDELVAAARDARRERSEGRTSGP